MDDPSPKGCAVAVIGDKCEVHLHIKVSFYSAFVCSLHFVLSNFIKDIVQLK